MLLSLDSPHHLDPILNTLRSLLTRGRHAEADRLAQSHRRRVSPEDARAFLALRAEIALGLGRFTAALEWSSAALRGIGPQADLAAALQSSCIRALIGLGRFREAEARLEGEFAALDPLGAELSLFRAQVALHSGGLARAAHEATNACVQAVTRRQRGRLVEALLLRARTFREEGDTPRARADLDRARRLANGLRDASSLAGVLADRADLMAHSGNWTEAARDAGQSGRLFARALSPHEHLSAGRRTGLLGLAQGEPGALPAIERAADLARRGFGTVECRAEIDLLLADAQLAGRDPEGALERATAALSFFRGAQDPGGLARAHVRRSLAALSASNMTLAFREARAAGSIKDAGPVARGLAEIALGRVLLRKDTSAASASFDRAISNPSLYPPLRSVAQLGLALANGASPRSDAVQERIAAVEAFGDLRILAIVRSDMQEMFGMESGVAAPRGVPPECGGAGAEERGNTGPAAALAEFLPGLFGESEPVRRLSGLVRKAAPSSLPVAIYGETGTGKEKVARAIHDLSPRRDREFVPVNAASLSDELFESETFGHVRGSFTGALTDRPGLVEKAKGGTLFIDEVADLSPRSQVRLLRFVEGGVYPSLFEGFGFPVVEAMACGTPVLTSSTTSLGEIGEGAALLVDPLDTAAISAGLRALAGSRELREDLRERGLARASSFSWAETGRKTLAAYRQAIAQ